LPGAPFVADVPGGYRAGFDFDPLKRHRLSIQPGSERPNVKLYLALFAVQVAGAIVFVWQELTEFEWSGI
jgi:hypothetical protein